MNFIVVIVSIAVLGVVGGVVGLLESRSKANVAAKEAALAEMTAQRDYWRTRAERLDDAALARAGAIHQPTMESRVASSPALAGLAALTTALSVGEIDSSKRKG